MLCPFSSPEPLDLIFKTTWPKVRWGSDDENSFVNQPRSPAQFTETSILPPLNFLLQEAIAKIAANTPFLRSKNAHFQNEAKCKTFLVKMKFICTRLKSIFISIGFALSLALKQRLGATRKWLFVLTHLYPSSFFKDLSKYGWKI